MAQACVVEPVRQVGSFVQVLEQPDASPKNRPFGPAQPVGHGPVVLVPQSQPSFPSFTPLPQVAPTQTLGVPVHEAPTSTWQIPEQPSPPTVFPSSHASAPIFMASPHAGTQRRPGTRHS